MGLFKLIKTGIAARKAFRVWRQEVRARKARKSAKKRAQEAPMFKGKLTYSAIIGLALVSLGQWLGVPLLEGDAAALIEAGSVLVAVYGRWRATRS